MVDNKARLGITNPCGQMKIAVNCGACPDLHQHDVDGVIMVNFQPEGGIKTPDYLDGDLLLVVIRWPNGTMDISMPNKMTRAERRALPELIQHLDSHHADDKHKDH